MGRAVKLVVYVRPACPFSLGVVGFLFLRGADFRVVNLERHPDQRERVDQRLGDTKLETPILEHESGALHVAPGLSQLSDLLESWGVPLASSPYAALHG